MDKALIFQNLQYLKKKVTSTSVEKSQYKQQHATDEDYEYVVKSQQSKKRKQHS